MQQNPIDSVQQKEINAGTLHNTSADEFKSEIPLNSAVYNARTVSILQNTYLFAEKEAREISACIKAISDEKTEINPDLNSGFLQKLKALCAKIMKFFGNESKVIQLQKEGISAFNDVQDMLLSTNGREFVLSFLEKHKDNIEILNGLVSVLGLKLDPKFDTREQIEAFVDLIRFSELKSYIGKNGKISVLNAIIDQCLDDNLSLEDRQKKLKTFLKVFNKNAEIPQDMGNDEYFCFNILMGHAMKFIPALEDAIKHKDNNSNELKELAAEKETTHEHVRLYLALRKLGINDMRRIDIDSLKWLEKFANEKKLSSLLVLGKK